MGTSPLARVAELAATVRSADQSIQTQPFLSTCRQILPVIEKMGTGFVLVKSDIAGNIERLAVRAQTDPTTYALLFAIVLDDVAKGEDKGTHSVTKGLLWLKRALEFLATLLDLLYTDRDVSLSQAASDAYYKTLYAYHGWISSGAFAVALKIVPSKESFFAALEVAQGDDIYADLRRCVDGLSPLLADIDAFLKQHNLDDPTKV